MSFIIRRKDPPAYEGAKTYWQTVGHRDKPEEAKELIATLKKISKKGTAFWWGDEEKQKESNNET